VEPAVSVIVRVVDVTVVVYINMIITVVVEFPVGDFSGEVVYVVFIYYEGVIAYSITITVSTRITITTPILLPQ